jgi:hypothetical protein
MARPMAASIARTIVIIQAQCPTARGFGGSVAISGMIAPSLLPIGLAFYCVKARFGRSVRMLPVPQP